MKQLMVRDFLSLNGISLCVLVETRLNSSSLPSVCGAVFGQWSWLSNMAFSDKGTRIVIAWDRRVMDVMVLDCHAQYIHCYVCIKGESEPLFFTAVYGSNYGVSRRLLWSGLRKSSFIGFKAVDGNG